MTLTMNTDDSRFIYASIASLEEHLLWGSLLASLVVMFFIRNIRAVIISALAIPASIIATFTLMRAMDFTLNNMTLLGADARRRHRHRRRDRGAGEHLPLHRGEGPHAVRRRHRGHARGGAAGDGHHAVADRHLPAGGVHDRLRAPLHLPVRLDDGVRDSGLDDRQLHADADAQLALAEDIARRARDEDTKHHRLFRALDRWYSASLRWTLAHPMAIIGISAALVALTFPLNRMVGRTFVPTEDMAEFTVHADTPQGTSIEGTTEIARNVVQEIGEQEGVSHVAYLAGADRYTHFHVSVLSAAGRPSGTSPRSR